jgi:hypothetical protein
MNIAFSGSIHGGITPGITMIAGESKRFKCVGGETPLIVYKKIKNN